MASLNKVLLIGNLTRDPELRHTPKGTAVCELSIAVNRVWIDEAGTKQEEATFVDLTAWGRTAENIGKYLTKGSSAFAEGRLHLDTWDDKTTGQKRSKLKVIVENIQFLGSPSGSRNQSEPSAARSSPPPSATNDALDQDRSEDFETDIPF